MTDREQAAALVRAIRRVVGGIGAVTFTVRDVHVFADRLLVEGVTVNENERVA